MIASGFQKSTTIQEHEVGFMKFTMIEHVQLPRKYLREKSVLPHYLRDVSADTQIFTESRIKLKDQSISRPPSVHTACRRHTNAMYRIVIRTISHIKIKPGNIIISTHSATSRLSSSRRHPQYASDPRGHSDINGNIPGSIPDL